MTIKGKQVSAELIYDYFIKKNYNVDKNPHFFIKKEKTLEKSVRFLKILRDLEKEDLSEKQRTKRLIDLSEITTKLWGSMLKDALDSLDDADDYPHSDTISGVVRLKRYISKFKGFEMLLYGSDKWYRDTIYHQLWFYFVGEYLFSSEGFDIMAKLLESKNKGWYCEPPDEVIKISKEGARHASFCVIALCHDLGKPLQKFHSINKAISIMLEEYKFLHFTPFKVEFPITYQPMLNFLVERLGQIGIPDRDGDESTDKGRLILKKKKDICPKVNVKKKNVQEKEETYFVKMKDYMFNQPHMQAIYSTALAELDHGLLSCLLLMESFRRFKGGDPYHNWKMECESKWIQKSYMTSQYILKPIAYHSMDSTQVNDIYLSYFWVFLIDDLIEAYRPTRAGKDFISQSMCKVRIKEASMKKIHLNFEFIRFENQKHKERTKNVIHFFIDKIVRFTNLLLIEDFIFKLEVEMKTEDNKQEIFMEYKYLKKKTKEKHIRLKYKKEGYRQIVKRKLKEIEDFLMLDKEKKIEKIKKELVKYKEYKSIY